MDFIVMSFRIQGKHFTSHVLYPIHSILIFTDFTEYLFMFLVVKNVL